MSDFFSSNFDTLPKALDASALSNTIIAQNLANVETPGYKRKEVDFENYLRKAMGDSDDLRMKTDNTKHISNYPNDISSVKPRVRTVEDTLITNDGNNVDIDREEALLAANTIRYQSLSRLMDMTISGYNTVLRGVT